MVVVQLGCGPLGTVTRKGTGEGQAERKSDDEAEIDAKENAARSASGHALEAAIKLANLQCPVSCRKKQVVITVDAPTTDGPEHAATKGKWKCKAEADWHLKIQCFETLGELKGEATLPGTDADPVRLRCGIAVIRSGDESGKAEAVTPRSAAEKTAKAKAEDAAFSHIEDALKKFTCRGRCPRRKLILFVGPPKITAGPEPTAEHNVWHKDNLFDCEASCAWELTIECQKSGQ